MNVPDETKAWELAEQIGETLRSIAVSLEHATREPEPFNEEGISEPGRCAWMDGDQRRCARLKDHPQDRIGTRRGHLVNEAFGPHYEHN